MAIVKNNDLLSKYWLKAYSRAARYFSNMCNKMESHLFSKDTRLNQYIRFEMLLYTHPDYYIHIQDFKHKQTSQLKNADSLALPPDPHLTKALRGDASNVPTTGFLCTGF